MDILTTIAASKPDGTFVMLGGTKSWADALLTGLHPMAKLLVMAEQEATLAALQELPLRDIRTALHVQDYASLARDLEAQRFNGLILDDLLTPEVLGLLLACLLPGAWLISRAPLAGSDLPTSHHWQPLRLDGSGESALHVYVKGNEVRRRGTARRKSGRL